MKISQWIAAPLLTIAIVGDASALGAVSRACKFSTIPVILQPDAAAFFYTLGAPYNVFQLPVYSSLASRWWINESLTVDWLSVKYYLYAYSVVSAFHGQYGSHPGQWRNFATYSSPGWRADTIDPSIKNHPKLGYFFANRALLYSARAGYQYIGHDADPLVYSTFSVVGSHYYYDPVSKVNGAMRATYATNCNLGNVGQDTGLFDR